MSFDPTVLASLFDDDLRYALDRTADNSADLSVAESVAVATMAPRRIASYSTGRYLSRRLLQAAGFDGFDLLPGDEREPCWPAGVVGSISHTDSWCLAAISTAARYRNIGVDLEQLQPMDNATRELVLTPQERVEVENLPALAATKQDVSSDSVYAMKSSAWPSILFSIKESLFKCSYPLDRQWIDFHQVSVSIDPAHWRYTARFKQPTSLATNDHSQLIGRFCLSHDGGSDYVFSMAALVAH